MNRLQEVEMELFRCFAEACEKLNLNYFLVCGSALGAMRHGGFIPWDDDMDVGMYREDYNIFMEMAPAILPDGIFLQNYKTDPEFPTFYAKLRNSNTTYVEKPARNLDINHGIYMDIFPLDGFPSEPAEQKKLVSRIRKYKCLMSCAFDLENPSKKASLIFAVLRFFGVHKRTAKIAAKLEAVISKYPIKNSKLVCNHATWYGKRDFIAAEYYGKGADAEFEGMKVRVPELCDSYLTSLYGDWRKLPPVEKQRGHHYYDICDTEKSYKCYVKDRMIGT